MAATPPFWRPLPALARFDGMEKLVLSKSTIDQDDQPNSSKRLIARIVGLLLRSSLNEGLRKGCTGENKTMKEPNILSPIRKCQSKEFLDHPYSTPNREEEIIANRDSSSTRIRATPSTTRRGRKEKVSN